MSEVYENRGEWSGYTVHKAAKGFVVSSWSKIQGSLTDAEYLIPYGRPAGGYGYGNNLQAHHNDQLLVGEYLACWCCLGHPDCKVLRKGHLVQ
jgi:hypothetical protein